MRTRRLGALVAILGLVGGLSFGCVRQGPERSGERDDVSASTVLGTGWDLNGDQEQEIVMSGPQARDLWVYPGGVEGSGGRPDKLTAADLGVPTEHFRDFRGFGSGDLNGDGYDDLVVCLGFYRLDEQSGGQHWSRLGVVLGGEQGLSRLYPMEPERRDRDGCAAPTLADLDGDGYQDTIHVSGERLRWTRGTPDVGPDTDWQRRTIAKPFIVKGVVHRDFDDLVLGDVNGDERLDLLYATNGVVTSDGEAAGGRGITVRLGTEDGFGRPDTWVDEDETVAARLGDVDGDGFDDLVTYNSEHDPDRDNDSEDGGVLEVRHGSEKGLAPPDRARTVLGLDRSTEPVGGVSFPKYLDDWADEFQVVDLDQDGAEDIVVRAVSPHTDVPAIGELLVVPGGERSQRSAAPYRLSKREVAFNEQVQSWDRPLQVRKRPNGELEALVASWTAPTNERFRYVFDRRDIRLARQGREPDTAAPATEAARPWDFAGDGDRSLVIEVPGAEPNGAVVLFGLSDDAAAYPTRPEGRRIAPDLAEQGWRFGGGTASGDFDSDGYADLAVCGDQGMSVLFGSPDGLDEAEPVGVWVVQNTDPCEDLEASDVDGDGFDDLLVTAPSMVGWAPGGPGTRSAAGLRVRGLGDGRAVAGGDVNGDGHLDVVSIGDRGVSVARGSGAGPDVSRPISDVHLLALAVGDVNGDGFDDLVGGVPDEVLVWPGSQHGIGSEPMARITAGDVGVSGSEVAFGHDLAVEDVDEDGYAEIAIGAPGAEVAGVDGAGAVVVVPGDTEGPSTPRARTIQQDSVERSGNPEQGDRFGERVRYRDLLPAEGPELLVVSPGEDDEDGKVHLIASDGEVRQFRPEDAGIDAPGVRFGDQVVDGG